VNIEEIKECIPHRHPFLWLDEVVELTSEKIHARKFLAPELEIFEGHYPGQPIFPGVLQCEAAFQAGAVLIAKQHAVEEGKVPVVTRLNNTKFRNILKPGETLDIEVTLTETLANAFFLTGKISSAGKVATRLEFACALAEV